MSDDVESVRCTGRTAAGSRCSRRAEEGTTRCAQHGYKPRGRPSKLTPELTAEVVYLVLEGNYLETAAQAVGISVRTLHNWRARGDDAMAKAEEAVADTEELAGDKLYEHVDPREWVYIDFFHALKTAEAYAETELLRRAASGGFGWQAPMTVLERRHPSRWRRRESRDVEVSGNVGRTTIVVPDTEEKRHAVAAALAGTGLFDDVVALGSGPAKGTPTATKSRTPRKSAAKRRPRK